MCHSLSLCEQMVMGWELVNDKSEELALPGGWSPNRPILHNEKWDRSPALLDLKVSYGFILRNVSLPMILMSMKDDIVSQNINISWLWVKK